MIHYTRIFRRLREQINGAALMQNGKAVQHRVALNIRTANVQKPAQAVWQGDNGCGFASIR